MLDTQDFANWLSDNLNAIGAEQTDKYSFNVIAEVGEVKHGGLINCIVRSLPPELVPVRVYVEVRYVFAVDFIVPAAKTNYN